MCRDRCNSRQFRRTSSKTPQFCTAHGANESKKMGTYALTALSMICVVFVASSVLVLNTARILAALGQPSDISTLAGEFALWMLPGIPFLYVYEVIRKVLQSRNETVPTLVASVVATLINVVFGTYLVGA